MTFIEEKIRISCELLGKNIYSDRKAICDIYTIPTDYKRTNTPPADGWEKHGGGDVICKSIDCHRWFKFEVNIPETDNEHEYRLLANGIHGWDASNPQCTIFIDSTTAYQAFDTNHLSTPLTAGHHNIFIYYYTGMDSNKAHIDFTTALADLTVESLYYDIFVPYDALRFLPKDSANYALIRSALNRATMMIDFRYPGSDEFRSSVRESSEFMKHEFYGKLCGRTELPEVNFIGHTHIDVAWLWTLEQTKEKAQRSFSTAVRLLERYPDYIFQSSQPQLYSYVKENDPELYAKIKKYVAEGRWEVEGAMWLEADTNLIDGESLVRQILLGKKFMREEFGVESRLLWLPDVFGYSAALPQILKKSGVPFFFTSKISWSETNRFPHDNFIWQGIDGSRIFAVLSSGYVRKLDPAGVNDAVRYHVDKEYTNKTVTTFGFGDGGGGPTCEMLENYERLKKGLPGFPAVKIAKSADTINRIAKDFEKNSAELKFAPVWCGELYLEMHRGTYTSIAKNKKNNRKCEILYRNVEAAAVTDSILTGKNGYPCEMLDRNWHTILKNQFHDIIPGSSIKQVYDNSDIEYDRLLSEGKAAFDLSLSSLASNVRGDGIFVYNPNGFELSDYIEIGGRVIYAENIPAHGWKTVKPTAITPECHADGKTLTNDLLEIGFDDSFNIVSVRDKKTGRELIEAGKKANLLEVFEDYPRAYDAWEITEYYKLKSWTVEDVSDVSYTNEPSYSAVRITRNYKSSRIIQTIRLKNGSTRLDFETEIDWHEDHVLLKAAFPLNIHADSAKYEIQFGHINRPTHCNTSWDEAKFEVCGHKWVDMSENGYGVSLLNDCKYGFSTEQNTLKISLLKAATYPNPEADRGHHSFTYSLFPHSGSFAEGGTVKEAYLLNNPLIAKEVGKADNAYLPDSFGLVSSSYDGFVIETIKKAEDGDGIIIRGYEAYNGKASVSLDFGFDAKEAYLCDLTENRDKKLEIHGNSVGFEISNFEIVTLRIII